MTALVSLVFCIDALHSAAAQDDDSEETFKPFKLRTLDGKERTLADFSNKAVLVSFFFPTCPYCNQSLPQVQRIYDRYKDQGLSAVWINTVPAQDHRIPEWQKFRHFSVPVLLARNPAALQYDYQIKGTPTHYLLAADGRVLLHLFGYSQNSENVLEDAVKKALGLVAEPGTNPAGSQSNVVLTKEVEARYSSLPDRPRLTRPVDDGPRMVVEEHVAKRPTITIEGTLQQFDCLEKIARLRIRSDGKAMAFAIADPDAIEIKGKNSSTIEFTCGMQKALPLLLEFEPIENKSLGTIGNVRTIEFK